MCVCVCVCGREKKLVMLSRLLIALGFCLIKLNVLLRQWQVLFDIWLYFLFVDILWHSKKAGKYLDVVFFCVCVCVHARACVCEQVINALATGVRVTCSCCHH